MLIGLSDGFRHEPRQQQSGAPAVYCGICNTAQPD